MKRLCLLLIPAALLLLMVASGCNDDPKPQFTRILVSPNCGVAPLQVEGYAIVSGGDETGSATGGNNNLEVSWNFGDGQTSNTSLAYNQYNQPGEYTVIASAKDPNGDTASASFPIRVLADSLIVEASSDFPSGSATTADTIQFSLLAESCDINPDNPSDYVKMIYRWHMNDVDDHVYSARSPLFRFQDPGDYTITLDVIYPAWAVTRHDTLNITVSEAP